MKHCVPKYVARQASSRPFAKFRIGCVQDVTGIWWYSLVQSGGLCCGIQVLPIRCLADETLALRMDSIQRCTVIGHMIIPGCSLLQSCVAYIEMKTANDYPTEWPDSPTMSILVGMLMQIMRQIPLSGSKYPGTY